ncbi:MAG: AraC family transcriptional regulator [Burkholderiales bacterium]|nr:AraC family transcriptional regulator [Burkholderiales bacterium]
MFTAAHLSDRATRLAFRATVNPPVVRAAVLAGFERLAADLQLDALALVRRVGLAPRCLRSPDMVIPAVKAYRLLELAAAISGTPDLGLRLSQRGSQLSSLGALGALIRDEPNVRSALQRLAGNLSMHSTCIELNLHESPGLAVVRIDVHSGGELLVRQATESALGGLVHLLRGFMGTAWRPTRVMFIHRCAATDRPHRRLFGCPVHFEMDSNAVVLPSSALDQPVPLADSRLRRYANMPALRDAGVGKTDAHRVRSAINRLLPAGSCTSSAVAAELGVSRRTLTRQLAAGGERYGELLAQARLELARQYLAGGALSMTQIAGLLGFATLSSFSRWFVRHMRAAPSRWRG